MEIRSRDGKKIKKLLLHFHLVYLWFPFVNLGSETNLKTQSFIFTKAAQLILFCVEAHKQFWSLSY